MTKLFSHIKETIKVGLFNIIENPNQDVLWCEVLDNLKLEAQITNTNKLDEILSSLDEHFTYLNLVDITSHKAVNEDDEINDNHITLINYFIVYLIEELFYKSTIFRACDSYEVIAPQKAKQLWVEIDELTKGDWYYNENIEKLFFG